MRWMTDFSQDVTYACRTLRGNRSSRQCAGGVWNAFRNVVGPGYFATMGIPVLEGRDFMKATIATRRKWQS